MARKCLPLGVLMRLLGGGIGADHNIAAVELFSYFFDIDRLDPRSGLDLVVKAVLQDRPCQRLSEVAQSLPVILRRADRWRRHRTLFAIPSHNSQRSGSPPPRIEPHVFLVGIRDDLRAFRA